MQQKVMRIALINFGGIGDEILFLPTIMSLKKRYKDAHITLVLEPRAKAIKELTNLIDDVIECDIKSGSKITRVLGLILKLMRGKFDMIVASGASPLISLVLFLSGIKKRYGYNTGVLSRVLLSGTANLNKNQYAANMYHDLTKPFCGYEPALPLIDVDLDSNFEIEGSNVILIHPGSSKLSKQKNIIKNYEFWQEVIEGLKDKYNVVLVGGPDDGEIINSINTEGILNLYGKTKNIKDLAALINGSDLLLCVDSAPMHIAVALNKPLVALFGPTDEKKLLPEDKNFVAVTTHLSCRPCLWDKRSETCESRSCLKIPSDEVMAKVAEMLLK